LSKKKFKKRELGGNCNWGIAKGMIMKGMLKKEKKCEKIGAVRIF